MASSFLILRFVIPMPESTDLMGVPMEDSRRSWGDVGADGAKRFMIRPLPDLSFRSDCRGYHRDLGCAQVAEFAGVVRNLPS